jgi:hypothetical protein
VASKPFDAGLNPVDPAMQEMGPPVGSPEEVATNPVVVGVQSIQQFGLALKEKGDPKGDQILQALMGVVQAMGASQGSNPQQAPSALPKQAPSALPRQAPGRSEEVPMMAQKGEPMEKQVSII